MLAHPTLDQLNSLGLYGLAKGFKELEHKPEARSLDHAERLGLLLEYDRNCSVWAAVRPPLAGA